MTSGFLHEGKITKEVASVRIVNRKDDVLRDIKDKHESFCSKVQRRGSFYTCALCIKQIWKVGKVGKVVREGW
jgi:hypothetical protein